MGTARTIASSKAREHSHHSLRAVVPVREARGQRWTAVCWGHENACSDARTPLPPLPHLRWLHGRRRLRRLHYLYEAAAAAAAALLPLHWATATDLMRGAMNYRRHWIRHSDGGSSCPPLIWCHTELTVEQSTHWQRERSLHSPEKRRGRNGRL